MNIIYCPELPIKSLEALDMWVREIPILFSGLAE